MRILLCHCSSFAGNDLSHPRVEHLGLAYLAAVARREGHHVTIVDANIEKLGTERLLDRMRDVSACSDLIGFSVISTNYAQTRQVVTALRAAGFGGHITFGGYFPTFLADSVFGDCPGIDSVVQGEAELSFALLIRALEGAGEWRALPGILFRDGSAIIRNPAPELIADLDELPFPARDTLPTLLRYRNPVISVSPARGCYMKCNFCSIIEFYKLSPGRAWRERSPDNILDEIEGIVTSPLCRKQQVDFVWFCADEFVGLKKEGKLFAQRFAEATLRRGLRFRWEIACRTDQVDYGMFRLLKEAGLRSVYVGAESFSQRQLDSYRKNNTVECNLEAIRVFDRLKLDYTLGTIVFSSDTSLHEFEQNHAAIRSIGYRHVTMPLSRLKLFQGTPAARTQRERSLPVLTAARGPGPEPIRHSICDPSSTSMERDPRFPLDDVYGYEFEDDAVCRLWAILRQRNDANEQLVNDLVEILDQRLIDGVSFWKLVFLVRDGLAGFIDEAISACRDQESVVEVRRRQDEFIASAREQLATFHRFLKASPEPGTSFTIDLSGAIVVISVPFEVALYIPGSEKETAESEYASAQSGPRSRTIHVSIRSTRHRAGELLGGSAAAAITGD